MQSNTKTRNHETYVLTDHGFAKIDQALEKVPQKSRVTYIFDRLPEPGTPNKDTIRKIVKRTDGVREDCITSVFQALGLVAETKDYQLVRKTDQPDTPPPPKAVPYSGNEPLPNIPVWRGRDDLLNQLQGTLQDQNLRVLVLIGQGGIGKTSLAVKLMAQIKTAYQQVLYFRVRQGDGFDNLMGFLLPHLLGAKSQNLDALTTPQAKITATLQALDQKRCLLVLDNLEELLEPLAVADQRAILPQARSADLGLWLNTVVYGRHSSHLVITTRELPYDLTDRRGLGVLDPLLVKTETITGVSKAAGVEILQDLKLADNQGDLEWIADRVDGHVLMLKILVGVSKGRGYLRQHPELVQTQAATVLRSQLNRLSPMAQELLLRLAVLRMPIDSQGLTFLRLCPDDLEQDDRFEMAVLSAEPIDFLPEELNETANLLQNLIGMSLVQSSYNEAAREEFYDLHPVIRQFLQGEYKTRMPELMTIAYNFYQTAIDLTAPKTREDLNPLLEAQYFAFQLKKYDEAEDLIYQAEDYLRPWGNWSELMELYEQILPHVKRHSQPYILQRIGSRHRDWGNWDKAEQYYREGLAIAEAVEDKRLIARFTGHLGDIERKRGNWDEAESLYRQSLQMSQELGDRSGMADSWGQLGDIERKRGNWDEAESLYRQSLQMHQELGDRSGMADSWGQLGDIERKRGNWDEAESLYRQSLQMHQELGDRKGMAEIWGSLGNIENIRGNWDAAEQLYSNPLEIRQNIMEPDHPDIADLWLSYGKAQLGKRDYQKAADYFRRALTIYQNKLGAGHQETRQAQMLLDGLEQAQSQPQEAMDIIPLFMELIQQNPEIASALQMSVAQRLSAEPDADMATLMQEIFLELCKTEPVLMEFMANLNEQLGDTEASRDNWDTAETIDQQGLAAEE